MSSTATVHAQPEAAGCTLPLNCVACEDRRGRPWQQIRAIHAIAQQFTALQLAQVAAPARCGGEPAGWSPAKLQHRRRALHTLALAQRLLVQTPCKRAALLIVRRRLRAGGSLQCGGDVTTGRHALVIALLSSHPRANQAVSSVNIPRAQGQANQSLSCLTSIVSQLVSVETLGQSSMVSRHNRERDPF